MAATTGVCKIWEAELGHVGSGANVDDIVNADHYTNVEQAVEFVERTGCGSLAVAGGQRPRGLRPDAQPGL